MCSSQVLSRCTNTMKYDGRFEPNTYITMHAVAEKHVFRDFLNIMKRPFQNIYEIFPRY